jgi:hypothetical protein
MLLATENRGVAKNAEVAVLTARLVDAARRRLQPIAVGSITYSLRLVDARKNGGQQPAAGHEEGVLDVRDVIFDTLQTGEDWTVDDIGYNFRHRISLRTENESFCWRAVRYEIRYEIILATGEKSVVVFRVRMVPS